MQAPVVVAHRFSCSVACGIFPKDQTRVTCIGTQILIHCTTREVLNFDFLKNFFIWLYLVLVAAHGLFNVCRSMQDYSCTMWNLVP